MVVQTQLKNIFINVSPKPRASRLVMNLQVTIRTNTHQIIFVVRSAPAYWTNMMHLVCILPTTHTRSGLAMAPPFLSCLEFFPDPPAGFTIHIFVYHQFTIHSQHKHHSIALKPLKAAL